MLRQMLLNRHNGILWVLPTSTIQRRGAAELTHRRNISAFKYCVREYKPCLVSENPCKRTSNSPLFSSAAFCQCIPLSSRKPKLFQTQFYWFSTSSSLSKSRSCWKCGRDTNPDRELFFCECGVVQSTVSSLTYFDLLQQEPSFELDPKYLGVIFRDTQKLLHPDMFSSKSKEEQQLAEEQSSLLNKAYETLLKPLSRAIYMLKLQDVTIDEKDTISDPEFLMDIMNINEQIDEASSAADINGVEETNNFAIAKCVQEIIEAFREDRIQDAKSSTIKLRYFTTISERILDLRRRELG